MEEHVQYTLKAIDVLDFSLPATNEYDAVEIDDVLWQYTRADRFTPDAGNKIKIQISYTYFLYLKNDPEKKKITTIATSSTFLVTRTLSPAAKLIILVHLHRIATGNLIGVYAAKAEKTQWAEILPMQEDFDKHIDRFKTIINDHWN